MQKREKLFSSFGMIPPSDPLDLRNIGKPFYDQTSYDLYFLNLNFDSYKALIFLIIRSRKVHVSIDSFDFKPGTFEPFFFTLAIYDYDLQVKVSEDFEFDFNSDEMLKMIGKSQVKSPSFIENIFTQFLAAVFPRFQLQSHFPVYFMFISI